MYNSKKPILIKKSLFSALLALFIFVTSIPITAFADENTLTEIYVSSNGSDENNGAMETPVQSLNQALALAQSNNIHSIIITDNVNITAEDSVPFPINGSVTITGNSSDSSLHIPATGIIPNNNVLPATLSAFNLPKTLRSSIINKTSANDFFVLNKFDIKVNMDLSAIEAISKYTKADVNITAVKQNNITLSKDAKTVVGSRPVFEISANYGMNKSVSSLETGIISVEIPYTLGKNEKADNIYVVRIDKNGYLKKVANSLYDSKNHVVSFTTNYFSTYAIAYNEADVTSKNIQKSWIKDNIKHTSHNILKNIIRNIIRKKQV